jgi:hypothetical protein
MRFEFCFFGKANSPAAVSPLSVVRILLASAFELVALAIRVTRTKAF